MDYPPMKMQEMRWKLRRDLRSPWDDRMINISWSSSSLILKWLIFHVPSRGGLEGTCYSPSGLSLPPLMVSRVLDIYL